MIHLAILDFLKLRKLLRIATYNKDHYLTKIWASIVCTVSPLLNIKLNILLNSLKGIWEVIGNLSQRL